MLDHLKKLESLRGGAVHSARFLQKLQDVKRWQHVRLDRTYRDLAADARYAPAVAFFLDELYGAGDSIKRSVLRDRELIRMYPTIKRVLPKFAFDAVEKALAALTAKAIMQPVGPSLSSTAESGVIDALLQRSRTASSGINAYTSRSGQLSNPTYDWLADAASWGQSADLVSAGISVLVESLFDS